MDPWINGAAARAASGDAPGASASAAACTISCTYWLCAPVIIM